MGALHTNNLLTDALDLPVGAPSGARDGAHGVLDPVRLGGGITTLWDLNQARQLECGVFPATAVPPYKPGKPALMAVLRGTQQGWEVNCDGYEELFGRSALVIARRQYPVLPRTGGDNTKERIATKMEGIAA